MENREYVEETTALSLVENINIQKAEQSISKIQKFQGVIKQALVPKHDYGASYYGAKDSLLKPGAEKILMLMGLSSEYEIIEKTQDYEDGFFAFTVRCILKKNDQIITQGLGSCNSKERKYQSAKQDVYMLDNTCLKMAKKRAQVDATLTVASLSDIFTQDTEDMAQFEQSERMDNLTEEDAKNIKVTFGKHSGKTLGEIAKVDKSYLEWLQENARDDYMQKAAKMLIK
ncbi:hypothetical protein [Senegalia massiliensis]|uniref:Exodeoxyribonuclease X-like C-terminal domain-containing protein n=1 Tax=Senegalia massiliensis TaxID=1720316 RepID=A0A845QZL0_9CLOT|nr:hypothetical protein [Senegalia massiliensis]NBI08397.1 hypothetical protein [Senegalia massiliensis]